MCYEATLEVVCVPRKQSYVSTALPPPPLYLYRRFDRNLPYWLLHAQTHAYRIGTCTYVEVWLYDTWCNSRLIYIYTNIIYIYNSKLIYGICIFTVIYCTYTDRTKVFLIHSGPQPFPQRIPQRHLLDVCHFIIWVNESAFK